MKCEILQVHLEMSVKAHVLSLHKVGDVFVGYPPPKTGIIWRLGSGWFSSSSDRFKRKVYLNFQVFKLFIYFL